MSKSTLKCNPKISSQNNLYNKEITCIEINQITNNIPVTSLNLSNFNIPQHIDLPDPSFSQNNAINILFGEQTFFEILCSEQILLGNNQPILQKALLGCIVQELCLYLNQNKLRPYTV